jgi:glycosyltransferase involved in cell wall biosynthesis
MTVPITVLMSVYNGERFLKESIPSVLNQTFANFEFIIVNDGSRDSSLEIINAFATSDERILVIDKPNTGLTNSLNQGINQAKGEWIARIDADDICELNRFELQYAKAISSQSIVLIGSDLIEINNASQRVKIHHYPHRHNQLRDNLIRLKTFFAHSSYFYRSKIVRELGGYRECFKRSQDFDLSLRLSEVGEITCINIPLVRIRKHNQQASHEDNGIRQLVDSRVALVSYLLRQRRLEDPVAARSSEDSFEKFYQFVKLEIEKSVLFKYQIFIQQVQSMLLNLNFINFVSLCVLLLKSPHFIFYYFYYKFLGEKIGQAILKKWINRGLLCVD